MSLLRNFTPGGSEPDDEQPATDEQPTTSAQSEEPDETAPPAGRHAAGGARYAFSSPEADTEESADPAPARAVPSEVVSETDPGYPAEEEWSPVPVGEAPAAGEAPEPSFTPASEAFASDAAAPEAFDPEAFDPEATIPDPAPVPGAATAPAPVLSPLTADDSRPAARPALLAPDDTAPLFGDVTELRTRWQRVQGDFVDDPRAAVSNAADLVDQTAEALVDALRQRQRQLRATWQGGAADGLSPVATAPVTPDTEGLRLVMQRYRILFNELCRPA